MRVGLCLVMLALLVGCASGPAARYSTPSGRAEAVFRETTTTEVNGRIQNECMRRSHFVVEASDFNVRCQMQLNSMQSMAVQLAIGNSYSTRPAAFLDFRLAPMQNDVRVSARSWAQTQMAFGQVNTMALDNTAMLNEVMDMLIISLGGELTPGSSRVGNQNTYQNNSAGAKEPDSVGADNTSDEIIGLTVDPAADEALNDSIRALEQLVPDETEVITDEPEAHSGPISRP